MKNKIMAVILATSVMAASVTGCRESDRVSYNVSQEEIGRAHV